MDMLHINFFKAELARVGIGPISIKVKLGLLIKSMVHIFNLGGNRGGDHDTLALYFNNFLNMAGTFILII